MKETPKSELRQFNYYDNQGKEQTRVLRYNVWLDEKGRIEEIRNSYGFRVEKNSECFDYFTKKYENDKQIQNRG